ncbi:hypothetical protein SLEP1_g15386 [Rubroshorea leprosula]|uniref:Uncharacterized protein n=1 Tax=Rubroshorea leprosula TaxID=152421 RepID=A0AAV5IM75_9ROSI|nr:hypothetical protein SLEP1_g15386 [Rubroshorea leprosula]
MFNISVILRLTFPCFQEEKFYLAVVALKKSDLEPVEEMLATVCPFYGLCCSQRY